MMGYLWGERVNFAADYRRPLDGDIRHMFDDGFKTTMRDLAMLGRPSTPEAFYELGCGTGVSLPGLPRLEEDAFTRLLPRQRSAPETGFSADNRLWALLAGEYAALKRDKTLLARLVKSGNFKWYFSAVRDVLSKVDGLKKDEWKTGWNVLGELERKISAEGVSPAEAQGYFLQFFGFIARRQRKA